MSVRTVSRAATAERAWWKEAVFYQVYPRSFADGNGDGIGDLIGVIERLGYLADLGVDAIWLSPHYPSPQVDLGYDVSDYRGVHPDYGTLDDFRTLLEAAHERQIRVVIDLVLNHTSDQHPWFIESRSSRESAKRDWYVWEDPRDGGPPNNWMSQFGGSAWELDAASKQYYYHCFLREQPDLNYRNPEVRAAIRDVVRFWLDLGVDGLRLDAPDAVFEDAALRDHTERRSLSDLRRGWILARTDAERAEIEAGLATMFARQLDQPEVHDLMRDLRAVVDGYPDRVLIGETDQVAYYGSGSDELHLVFNFPLMRTSWLTPAVVRRNQLERWAAMPDGAWAANTLGNHDEPRVRSRHASGADGLATARLSAALVLTLPGTPFLYYGEEIGMTDLLLDDAARFRDSWGLWLHRAALDELGLSAGEALDLAARHGRDKSRTPMQWTNAENGGFSPEGAVPWLPVHANHAAGINVAEQREDPDSLLRFYRRLIRVRRSHPALSRGDCTLLNTDAPDYLAYLRSAEGESCVVVLNMAGREQSIQLGLPAGVLRTLSSSRERPATQDARAGASTWRLRGLHRGRRSRRSWLEIVEILAVGRTGSRLVGAYRFRAALDYHPHEALVGPAHGVARVRRRHARDRALLLARRFKRQMKRPGHTFDARPVANPDRSGPGSSLDKPRRAEVAVERQSLLEALPTHDGEARRGDERIDQLIVAPKPCPRLALRGLVDMDDREPVRRLDRVEEGDRGAVPIATAQERPGLADDVICRQDPLAGRPQANRGLVVGITPQPQRYPVRGIDEPHEP